MDVVYPTFLTRFSVPLIPKLKSVTFGSARSETFQLLDYLWEILFDKNPYRMLLGNRGGI